MSRSLAKRNNSSNVGLWIAGSAALAVALIVAKSFPMLRRYLKIKMM